MERQNERYSRVIEQLRSNFNLSAETDVSVYSAPGRAEIGGNHTDHQRGCVLAAAVNADIICAAAESELIELVMEGYGEVTLDPRSTSTLKCEQGSPQSLVLGILDYFVKNDYKTGGFRAYVQSDVREGSGLSSSAAFSNLVGTVLNHIYNGGVIPPIQIAKAGRHAENMFFGKPSGLMDQAASALGGFVFIDFEKDEPYTESIPFDPSKHGLTVCVVHTGGSHAGLTDEYAAITREMRGVAQMLGRDVLGYCDVNEFNKNISAIRKKMGDRAVLRACHFFAETKRAAKQAEMLKAGDLEGFLRLVNESGRSSIACLQNIYSARSPESQPISLALALAERILDGKGACRVHGGGFAGTILAFVPDEIYTDFENFMDEVFGKESCHKLAIRNEGVVKVI